MNSKVERSMGKDTKTAMRICDKLNEVNINEDR